MAKERVQKILARAGIASRRKAEEIIQEGGVTVNGKVIKLGDQAELGVDSIKVRGKLLQSTEAPVYLAFYKPKGVISMFGDPEGRTSLVDYMGTFKSRLFPVGRMDFNSEGLLLLTNDGTFSEQLQKRDDVIRVYKVKVKGHLDTEMIKRLERGAKLGTKMVRPESVTVTEEYAKKAQVEIVLVGGGAVDLKAYFEMKGFLVERITRVAFGHIRIGGLKPGEYRQLEDTQAKALLDQPELGLRRHKFEATKKYLPEVKDPVKATKVVLGGGATPSRRPEKRPLKFSEGSSGSRDSRPARGAPRFDREARYDRAPRSDRGSETTGKFGIKSSGDRPSRAARPDSRGSRPDSRGPRADFRGPPRDRDSSPRSRIMVRKKT
jgi:23S rRNA pseudouridine2605 synthase